MAFEDTEIDFHVWFILQASHLVVDMHMEKLALHISTLKVYVLHDIAHSDSFILYITFDIEFFCCFFSALHGPVANVKIDSAK